MMEEVCKCTSVQKLLEVKDMWRSKAVEIQQRGQQGSEPVEQQAGLAELREMGEAMNELKRRILELEPWRGALAKA